MPDQPTLPPLPSVPYKRVERLLQLTIAAIAEAYADPENGREVSDCLYDMTGDVQEALSNLVEASARDLEAAADRCEIMADFYAARNDALREVVA